MDSQELEQEIKLKVNSTVNKSLMINLIKQRFIVSEVALTELNAFELDRFNGFSGDISKYKKDKFGLYGGVKHGN